jgi:hypothetical protein
MVHYRDNPLTPSRRDAAILELRRRGYTWRAIGKAVGMDGSSVYRAWHRLAAGGNGTRARP